MLLRRHSPLSGGDARPGALPAQESGAQEASAALPVGAPGRLDPRRHQTAGPFRAGGPPVHRGSSSSGPWISSPSAPTPTRHAPTAMRSVSSKPSWRKGLTSSPTRHQRNAIVGSPAIWGSITAGGATWLSLTPALSSASSGCDF